MPRLVFLHSGEGSSFCFEPTIWLRPLFTQSSNQPIYLGCPGQGWLKKLWQDWEGCGDVRRKWHIYSHKKERLKAKRGWTITMKRRNSHMLVIEIRRQWSCIPAFRPSWLSLIFVIDSIINWRLDVVYYKPFKMSEKCIILFRIKKNFIKAGISRDQVLFTCKNDRSRC